MFRLQVATSNLQSSILAGNRPNNSTLPVSNANAVGITININAANALQLTPDFAESLARQLKPSLDALARRSA